MYKNQKKILNEYKIADFEKRLSMFMTNIELRGQFIEIDSNGLFNEEKKNSISEKFLNFICSFF